MKQILPLVLSAFVLLLLAQACDKRMVEDKQIARLEKELETNFSNSKVDSLLTLYPAAVLKHPKDQATNFRYLIKAAELQYNNKSDAKGAYQWLNEALAKYGQGQNLTEPITLLARIWIARQYRAAHTIYLDPDDMDRIRVTLEKNQNWLDSSLVRLEKAMGTPVVTDKAKANQFIEIAESYATVLQAINPNKHADLLLKAAGLARTIENPNKAIQLYYMLGEKIPSHPKAPTALFMMGFVYENDLGDLAKAKSTYEEFLKRYPNDPDYADDAQNALKLLGKSPDELVKEFEKQQQPQ